MTTCYLTYGKFTFQTICNYTYVVMVYFILLIRVIEEVKGVRETLRKENGGWEKMC